MTRESEFAYKCNACSRCCHNKSIQVNPYEIARLSANLGITTGLFIDRYLAKDGPYLSSTREGPCDFLGPSGCTVHKDRPLVCRLYPLGREVTPDGDEYFDKTEPHPETEGVYSDDGSVEAFLKSQDVSDFIDAADRYHALVNDLLSIIHAGTIDGDDIIANDWLDMDVILPDTESIGSAKELKNRMISHIETIRAMAIGRKEGEENGHSK